MRAIIVGDVHLSDRPPSIRTETYASDVLKKIECVVALANAEEVDALIFAGDVFHIKAPTRTSHRLVIATHERLSLATMPVLIVPGNHDMQHDRLESLDGQPLGALCKMDGVELLIGWHASLPVFGLPFLYDYPKELPPYMEEFKKLPWQSNSLMVTHAPIVQPGRTLPYEYIDADDWAKWMGPGDCYFGHMHDLDGTFKAGDVFFCNQGALSRGSLHESSLKRRPAVTVYDDETTPPFVRVEIPHRPVQDVFRLTAKQAEDDKQEKLDEFLSKIGQTQLEALSVELVLEHARTLGLDPATLRQIEEVVEYAIS